MPPGLVEDEDGMGADIDLGTDLDKMRIHGLGIAPGHDQTGPLAPGRADGSEDIG